MSKFRIAIQEFSGGRPRNFRNVMIVSDSSIDFVKSKMIMLFQDGYARWLKEFRIWLEARYSKSELFKRHGVGTDIFDKLCVGKDFSVEEFIKNEIDIELIESGVKEA